MPFSTPLIHKQFKLKEKIEPETPVTLSIAVACVGDRPVIGINGIGIDLSAVRKNSIEMIHLPAKYPEDGIFRFAFTEDVYPVLDAQRSYGRTYDKDGVPMNEEMVISLSTSGSKK